MLQMVLVYKWGLTINLKNAGDAPAINIYTLASIKLQFNLDDAGKNKYLSAALLPYFVQALSMGEEKVINIHFETAEVKELVNDLRKNMDLNWERLKTNPCRNHYMGAKLIIRVLFKNTMGQWFESSISYEIAWLAFKNPPSSKTNNLSKNTIPPKHIHNGDVFEAVLVSNRLAPFAIRMTTDEYVKSLLEKNIDDNPWLAESVDNLKDSD